MTGQSFRVSRSITQAGFLLEPKKQLHLFYDELTAYDVRVILGLFSLTDPKDVAAQQQIRSTELLEVLELSKGTYDGREKFDSRHYRDGWETLKKLYTRNIAIATKTVVKGKRGRKIREERSYGMYRILQGFGIVYYDEVGQAIDLGRVDREHKRNVNVKVDTDERDRPRKRSRKTGQADEDNPIEALIRYDRKTGQPVLDTGGNPEVRLPDAFFFDWAKPVAEDLQGKNHGFLLFTRKVFPILKTLHPNKTATDLFLLLMTDVIGTRQDPTIIEKTFSFWCQALAKRGLPNKNQRDIATAVRRLKEVGVLLPDSDEKPRIDDNPERRKEPYYRWKRVKEWTPKTVVEVVPIEEAENALKAERAQASELPPPRPRGDGIRGKDIQAAREAAGMTIREFAERFGKSIGFWSKVENEVFSKRAGKPFGVPPDSRFEVEAFVTEYLGWKDGNKS